MHHYMYITSLRLCNSLELNPCRTDPAELANAAKLPAAQA